jgi:hypothetical protein
VEFAGNTPKSFQVAGGPVMISDIDLSTGVGQCSIAPEPAPRPPVVNPPAAPKPPAPPAPPAKVAPVVTGLPNTGTGQESADSIGAMLIVGATAAAFGVALVTRRQHAE